MMQLTEEQRKSLIADCNRDIAELEKGLTTWGEAWIPSLQSKIKRQQIALAALTAEKKVTVSVVQKNERLKGFNFYGYESLPAGEHEFYTAPPVAALRLPDENELVAHLERCSELVSRWPEWKKKGSDAAKFIHILDDFELGYLNGHAEAMRLTTNAPEEKPE